MAISLRATGTAFAILLLLVVMLWFTWGTQHNISRGNRLLRWLQGGLPLVGRKATVRWLGSSAVELGIAEPRPPFAEVTVVVVLEARDIPWFWAHGRARGRRDFLILRARLAGSPRFELEMGDPAGWTGSDRLERLDETAWVAADWGRPGIKVLHAPGALPDEVRPIFDRLAEASGGVWRVSVRREPPHVEIHVLPPDPDRTEAAQRLVGAFVDLSRIAAGS